MSVAESVAFPRSSCALPRKRRPLGSFDVVHRHFFATTSETTTAYITASIARESFSPPSKNLSYAEMDSLGGGMSSLGGDPKTQIMRQVQQEAAMQNARMLVEVQFLPSFICQCIYPDCIS